MGDENIQMFVTIRLQYLRFLLRISGRNGRQTEAPRTDEAHRLRVQAPLSREVREEPGVPGGPEPREALRGQPRADLS